MVKLKITFAKHHTVDERQASVHREEREKKTYHGHEPHGKRVFPHPNPFHIIAVFERVQFNKAREPVRETHPKQEDKVQVLVPATRELFERECM